MKATYAIRFTARGLLGTRTRTTTCRSEANAQREFAKALHTQGLQGISNDAVVLINGQASPTTTASWTIAAVTALVATLAAALTAQGAHRDAAMQVATDHVLAELAKRPTAHAAYLNARATLAA